MPDNRPLTDRLRQNKLFDADLARTAADEIDRLTQEIKNFKSSGIPVAVRDQIVENCKANCVEIVNNCTNMLSEARLWLKDNPQTRDLAERINGLITRCSNQLKS